MFLSRRRFHCRPRLAAGKQTLVPGRFNPLSLLAPSVRVTLVELALLAKTDIDPCAEEFRKPLQQDAKSLALALGPGGVIEGRALRASAGTPIPTTQCSRDRSDDGRRAPRSD